MGIMKTGNLKLIQICVIAFVLLIEVSSVIGISPIPTESSLAPAQDTSNTLGSPFQQKGSDLHSPPALPPISSSEPSSSVESPPYNKAPPPAVAGSEVPPSPIPPILSPSPPLDATPPPSVEEGHVPSTLIPPTLSPPLDTAPPPSPISPILSPPLDTTPPPSVEEGHVPSTLIPPTLSPPLDPAPPPSIEEGNVPPTLSPPALSPPLNTAPPPSTEEGHVPPTVSPPTLSPPLDTAPPPSNEDGNVPSTPIPPTLSPPLVTAPPPSTEEGNVPSTLTPPISPPLNTAPPPSTEEGNVPPTPIPPILSPPLNTAPPPVLIPGHAPSIPPSAPNVKQPVKSPVSVPVASAPVAPPSSNSSRNSHDSPQSSPVIPQPPIVTPPRNSSLPPTPNQTHNKAPIPQPTAPAPISTPSRNSSRSTPPSPPSEPKALPPVSHAPLTNSPPKSPVISPSSSRGNPRKSPNSKAPVAPVLPGTPPSQSINGENHGKPIASPVAETPKPLPPVHHEKGSNSAVAPSMHEPTRPPPPTASSPNPSRGHHSLASSPSSNKPRHKNTHIGSAPPPSYLTPPPSQQATTPYFPRKRQRYNASPPVNPGSSAPPPHYHSSMSRFSPASPPKVPLLPLPHVPSSRRSSSAPAPSPKPVSSQMTVPHISPDSSPPVAQSPKVPLLPKAHFFPPPPPNEDCSTTVCTEPYTNTLPGSPCGCVLPMKVGLSLSVALYTFFPLVSELAEEIAVGVFMKQSQVRIMGANAASEQPEKTLVLADLVPIGQKFDYTTAFLIFQRFFHKQVAINPSFFGDYEVLYVHYPGLPASPPLPPSSAGMIDDGPYPGNNDNARTIKPLGVDVSKKHQNNGLSGGIIAIIVLSASVVLILCSAFAWVLLSKRRDSSSQQTSSPRSLLPSFAKNAGSAGSMVPSGISSASLSFSSSVITYAGSAKTFSASDIEKATHNFDESRVIGEGGFGRVYSGVLDDGTQVAVKVLKRDDQQGGREFLAEVEMLSRLHHRNLVKLIGICVEDRARCLVYELIPNGSVESHLHGIDKDSTPLDWDSRIKIALGAARGLAYLHEDSSPRVIHRDFKSSNILLENDYTPKVSDFGLARTALDEENKHISTRVMGTFGYVAPEYAMTGHLLVKSDVYSYGVVLLELLSGRKPVDMSQPPGQENLVAWARPLLTSPEGLQTIIDASLGPDIPFDSVAKVAAIASMCVQPEVSHRPFMGEVVQALKLVCNECDEAKIGSRHGSRDDLSIDMEEAEASNVSGHLNDPLQGSNLYSASARFGREESGSGSFRRQSSSGPLGAGAGRGRKFWQRVEKSDRGSVSEHGFMFRFWPGSH